MQYKPCKFCGCNTATVRYPRPPCVDCVVQVSGRTVEEVEERWAVPIEKDVCKEVKIQLSWESPNSEIYLFEQGDSISFHNKEDVHICTLVNELPKQLLKVTMKGGDNIG